MNKKINTAQVKRYTETRNAEDLISHLDGAYEIKNHFFIEADEAIAFLKSRVGMGKYEIEASANAILSATGCIEKFESDVVTELERLRIEEEERAKKAKETSAKVKKQFEGDVLPSLNAAIEDLKKISAINGYVSYTIKDKLDVLLREIKTVSRI